MNRVLCWPTLPLLPDSRDAFHRIPRTAPILVLLLGLSTAFAKDPRFADLPDVFMPATNAQNTMPSQGGTNTIVPKAAANTVTDTITNSMEALDGKYKLAIGDRLSFRIVEDEEDPKPLFVTDSGDLEVPYVGRFPVIGKSCKELAQALKKELERQYYYQATVIVAVDVMTKSRGKVYLVGPVRSPGPQEIPSDEVLTLSKAILRAGGFGDFADKKNVKVTRKATTGSGDQQFTINVAEILEKGVRGSDLPLEAGDLIYIPERSIRF